MQTRHIPFARYVASALGATVAGAAGVLVGAAAYAVAKLNHRPAETSNPIYTFSPYETQIEGYEEVSFETEDGIRLIGWWLPRPNSQRVVIGLGGHHSAKSDLLGIGSGLWRAGNNVLLFDWRSRGQSQVAQHSLAYYELRDAEAALNYAITRMPEARIGLVGFSMGASVALLLAARSPKVSAVLADSPFSGIAELLADRVGQFKLPAQLVVPMADALSHWRYGYRFGAVRPIEIVAQISPRPLLLVHGENDSVIPVSHTKQLFDAAREPKELWLVPGVEHCGAYFADRAQYVTRAANFFEQYLASID